VAGPRSVYDPAVNLGPASHAPLRLLLILTEFPPSFGGMQTHAIHLRRYLQQRGDHAEVATYQSDTVAMLTPVAAAPSVSLRPSARIRTILALGASRCALVGE